MVKLTEKYSQSIKTAIDSKNPMNQVEIAKPGSFKPTLNPYNQQQDQQLKPLPKADFEPLNNFVKSLPKQAEYLTDSMMASGRQLGRTIVNVPSAITYAAEQKIPQKESVKVGYTDVKMPTQEPYKPLGMPEVDTYKSVKASMESQYQYEYMPENTKKAYETVVDQILKQESVGKSFDEQRQLVADLYPDQNIPSFVARKLMNIDSKEKEYTLKLENARENLVNMAIKNADELRVIQEKYKDEPIIEGTKLFSEVMGSVIQMSPYMIASAAGGVGGVALSSIAGTGTMYTTVFTNAMATSLSEGATREQATEYAHMSAMIEAGTEMLSGGIPFAPKGLLSSGIQGKIDDAVKILVKDGTVRKFISKGVDVFGEGAEEALAEYLGSMAMTIYKEDERSEEELKADMIKSFMMGALTSATLQLGKVATIKMAEKFVAEKAVDVQNIPLADANKIMNKIALRSKVKDFDGLSYRLEEMPKGQNGYIINGDEIVLNKAQVEEDGLIESALPHEMVHALEKVKGYDKLANFAIQNKLQTLNMDLATLKEAYQEKFNEVHEQELANGNEGHVLEIATTEKMTREIVADFIKENVASRPVKDAQGNIKLDENGNVMTYRDYNALLKLASNHPDVMDKIKKAIRNKIRKAKIAEAIEFDETTKAQYLTTQAYLESLDTYLGEVLNNADKGLFEDYGVIDEIVFNMDPKVLSKGSDKILEVAKDYTQFSGKEVNPESLTREDAIELLKYSNENGLGFTSIETEDGIVNQPVDVAYSLDAKEEVESLQSVEVEQKPSEVYSREQSLFLNRVYKVEVFKRKDGLYSIYTTDRQGDIVEAVPLTEEQIKNNYGINNANILLSNLGDKTKSVYVKDLDIPRVVITEEEFNRVVKESKKRYGTTNSFVEGGFLTPDGYLLDFSGKKDGGPSNVRYMDHREFDVDGYDWQDAINKLGFVRMQPESSSINLTQPLTEQQKKKLSSYIQRFGQDNVFTIDLDKQFKEYKPGVLPNQVFSDLDTYFLTGKLPDANKVQYSLDNSLISQLNINKIVPMIEKSKQDAIDYINSISQSVNIDEAQKGNLTSYLDRLSNFVRDYNPNIRYDSMGNITMDQEESKYNLRDGNKLKVFYYPGNEYNPKAVAYGYIVGSTPVGMASPQEVYVNLKKPLYDVEKGSMDYLNYELQKDIDKVIEHYNGYGNDLIIDTEGLTNLEIIKAIGDILGKDKIKDFYNSLKAVTGYDGIEIPSSKQLILFDKEQFGSVKQRASYSEEAIKEFKNITFKKSGNNYIVLTNDFEDNQRTQVLDYNDVIDTFGKVLARTILGNATTQTQTLDMVENIIQKPNTKIEKGAFSVNRDDHDNQLTKKQDEFFARAEVRQPDGTLKVMYHGSPRIFDEFDYEQLGTNGLMEGTGFYFTDSSLQAGHYTQYGEGKLYEVYLNITKSANRETKSINKEQIKNAIAKINELDDGNLLSEFGDVEREGLEKVLDKATTKIHQNMNDVEMIEEILYLSPLNVESALRTITETTGIDGIKARSVDGVVYVAFFPEQIKSINNPNPTEDRRIQYSIDVQAENGIQETINKNGLSDLDNGKYILSDGRVIGDGDRVKGSIIIEPEVNRAVVLENPTQAQKEQLLSYFNNALRRESDYVYLELHDQYGNVSYEKYFVVSDFDKAIKKIDDFYNKSLSGEVDSKGRALTTQQSDFLQSTAIRDLNGKPLAVFHGTDAEFNEFSYANMGKKGKAYGYGFYFTDDPGYAYEHGNKMVRAYLNLTNPVSDKSSLIDKETTIKLIEKFFDVVKYEFENPRAKLPDIDRFYNGHRFDDLYDMGIISQLIQSTGIDVEKGLKIVNELTGIDGFIVDKGGKYGNIYVAFFPEQIKKVDNLAPTDSKDIRYSLSGKKVIEESNAQYSAFEKALNRNADSRKHNRVLDDGLELSVKRLQDEEQGESFSNRGGNYYYYGGDGNQKVVVRKPLVVNNDTVRSTEIVARLFGEDNISKFKESSDAILEGFNKGRFSDTPLSLSVNKDIIDFMVEFGGYTPQEAETTYNSIVSSKDTKTGVAPSATKDRNRFLFNAIQDNVIFKKAGELGYDSIIVVRTISNKVNLPKYDLEMQLAKQDLSKSDRTKYEKQLALIGSQDHRIEEIVTISPDYIVSQTPTESPDIRYSLEDEKIATRRYAENALRASNSKSTQSSLNQMIENGELEYVVVTDKKSIEKAIASIGNDVDGALNRFKAGMDSGKRMTKDDLVEAQLILKKLEKSRRTKDVVGLIRDIAVLGTELGQQVQALSLIRRMTPEGKLLTLQRTLNRMKENYKREGKTVNIEIPMEFQEYFVEAQARIDELTEQRMEAQTNNEELQRIEREIDSLLLSNVGEDVRTLSNELSELRALEREENRLKDLVEGLRNKASTLSNEDLDILQEDILVLKEQIILKQGSLKEIKRKETKLAQLETQLEQYTKGDGLYVDYNTELVQEQVNEYQSRIKEIEKQKRTYANLEQKLESLSGIDPVVVQEMKVKAKEVAKAEKLLKKLVAQNERFTSPQNIDLKLDEVKKAIAQQLPVGVMDKLNAWRYMSMLGNLRTNVRNVLGNAFMMPMMFSRDVISSVMEQAIPQDQRTRAIFATKESKEFAKRDYEANLKEIVGANKYNMQTEIERERTIFKTKVLEWMRQKTFDMLEAGDDVFVEKHYVTQLAKFLTARGYDLNTITDAQMEEARVFAIEEARKATFKDDSALATALNELARKGKVPGLIVESTLPFKKTPINVLKRGVEYSPIGLTTGVVKSLNNLRTGEYTAAQLIDNISAGLTGTGIALVGAWMYSMGFLEIGYDEDETKRVYGYKNSLGRQTYSIRIGDDSYSIDWIAPAIMPFILGATIQKVMENDSELSLMDAMYAGALDIFDPIFELSMLQGVTDTLRSFGGSGTELVGEAINTMAANYINQYIPTIVGQLARTIDPIQRSTQADATGPLSKFVETTARKVANKIPFAGAMFNAPVIDVKGQPISASENPFMRAFSNFVDPGRFKQANSVPEDTEILRLYELTKDTNVLPRTAPKSFSAGGATQRLGNDELSQFSTTMGELQYNLMGKFVSSLTYKRLTDDQRIEVLSGIYDHAYDEAKAEYLKGKGIKFDDDGYKKVKKAELKGVKVVDYLLAKKAYAKMSGKGTKENFQAYLDKNGMSSSLMEIIGGYTVNTEKITTKGLKKITTKGLKKLTIKGLKKLK